VTNLRELAESDLATTLESVDEWGLPVELVDPDGVEYTGLYGQVLYDSLKDNPETGGQIVVNKPVVTLRRSSLTRVPIPGERWAVRIPTTPSTTAALETFLLDEASELGGSLGIVRLYLIRTAQS